MNLTDEFYENLTPDQLEEYAEFVDWTLVPIHLITEELRHKFSCFYLIGIIIWFKKKLNSFEIKTDEDTYPNRFFFFINEKYHMEYHEDTGDLWCSYSNIWSFLKSEYNLNYIETQVYIKSIVEQHFKDIKIIFVRCSPTDKIKVEKHFKNMVIRQKGIVTVEPEYVEKHFRKIELTYNNI